MYVAVPIIPHVEHPSGSFLLSGIHPPSLHSLYSAHVHDDIHIHDESIFPSSKMTSVSSNQSAVSIHFSALHVLLIAWAHSFANAVKLQTDNSENTSSFVKESAD
jgi:hypothetical protein